MINDKLNVRIIKLFILLALFHSCSSFHKAVRKPSSISQTCFELSQSLLDRGISIGRTQITEHYLISKSLISRGELKSTLNDPVYKNIIYAENEAERERSKARIRKMLAE